MSKGNLDGEPSIKLSRQLRGNMSALKLPRSDNVQQNFIDSIDRQMDNFNQKRNAPAFKNQSSGVGGLLGGGGNL